MSMNKKLQYLGCGAAIFILLIVVLLSFSNNMKLVEGMSNSNPDPETIKSNTNDVEDTLLVNKYRKSYEDTIIELEDSVSTSLLSEVIKNAEAISRNPAEAQDAIVQINNLKALKDSLNDAMATLDKK